MDISQKKQLEELYEDVSKHSQYQRMPAFLEHELNKLSTPKINRYEAERFEFIKKSVDFQNKSVIDIGGNTGFFSFEIQQQGAKSIKLIEGNSYHCKFVHEVSNILNLNVKIENRFADFENEDETVDALLLLNVLHHVGDDYGNKEITIEAAKAQIIHSINKLAKNAKILVFQMGFCWKGNREELLFPNGTKKEMIDFIKLGVKDKWVIQTIGVPERKENKIIYSELTKSNLERQNSLGEFLNRPIFILKSLGYGHE